MANAICNLNKTRAKTKQVFLCRQTKFANISAVVVVAACFGSLKHTNCTGHLQAFAVSDSIERRLFCTRDHQNEYLRQKHIRNMPKWELTNVTKCKCKFTFQFLLSFISTFDPIKRLPSISEIGITNVCLKFVVTISREQLGQITQTNFV